MQIRCESSFVPDLGSANILRLRAFAGLAQWQCSGFVNRRSGVRIPHPAPDLSIAYAGLSYPDGMLATIWQPMDRRSSSPTRLGYARHEQASFRCISAGDHAFHIPPIVSEPP